MGRKGGGRKAFLKTAKNLEDDTEDISPPTEEYLPETEFKVDALATDPSLKFLRQSPDAQTAETPSVPSDSAKVAQGNVHAGAADTQVSLAEDETRGQLIQRHKREMKAHKEHMKKLGKKRKDEVEQLDNEIESRHNTEILAWESTHKEEDLTNTSLVAPSDGLYDLTIGDKDEKQSKKPTKAQKRREQKAAEEAEREARIAAEKEALRPEEDEKEKEAKQLQELLKPLGLTIKDIPADGHCMYRAVEDQLEACDGDAVPYEELREETASYMRAFPDDFRPFVTQEDPDGKDPAQQYDEYCDKVEETAAWGGQVELQALAQAIERHIVVHCAGLPTVEQGTQYKGKKAPLQICYLRHAYTLGEHYNSLRAA